MVQLILIRPGLTDYDVQARIQGTLDVPLCEAGRQQARLIADKVRPYLPTVVYAAPCKAAEETAEILSQSLEIKAKTLDRLQNLNQGLWQGLLVEEVRHKQPKVYKQWQEHPETVRPPQGESLPEAADRVEEVLQKLAKKHKGGVMALVVPEPLASLVRQRIEAADIGDLWKATNGCDHLEVLHLEAKLPDDAPLGNDHAGNGHAITPTLNGHAAAISLDTKPPVKTMVGSRSV